MNHRKWDTTKYRRRMGRQREKRAIRRGERGIFPQKTDCPGFKFCPLCNDCFTRDDARRNMNTVIFSGRQVLVHYNCPTEMRLTK